jgi:alpha-ketoglutarate-dependent taurine dioxygenase
VTNRASFSSGVDRLEKPLRRSVCISADSLIRQEFLPGLDRLPLTVKAATTNVDLLEWAKGYPDFIENHLLRHGAILFRGFGISSIALFEHVAEATSHGGLLDYIYGSTPRQRIAGGVYSSTEYPPDQVIPFHNEMSYSLAWPMKIWFCCLKAACSGGATPLADSGRVFEEINPHVRALFVERGVMYVRNYGSGLDLSCQQVFGTEDRVEIEKICEDSKIECEWKADGRLRTRQKCQAIAVHPQTGQTVWFNQAHLFHVSSLNPVLSAQLLAEFSELDLPRNAYYGDGSPIALAALDEIRAAYSRAKVEFSWEEGDVLMLDNMLVAHGRGSYEGERRIVVAMAEQRRLEAPEAAAKETHNSSRGDRITTF